MIEVPIDYVRPGDVLAKHHTFKKYLGGMSSAVDLTKGYRLNERILAKLKAEFTVQTLFIEAPAGDLGQVVPEEGFGETERQKIADSFVQNMHQIRETGVFDVKALDSVVHGILDRVTDVLRTGSGSFRTLSGIFGSIQSHDLYTWEHSVNVAIYGGIIALSLPEVVDKMKTLASVGKFSREEIIVFNLLLHDVGKTKIPLKILNKNTKLSESEWALVRRHPYAGLVDIRRMNDELTRLAQPIIPAYFARACLYHHQAYDGTGYPELRVGPGEVRPFRGREIPMIGRIAAAADVYDALTSRRPYRLPMHPAQAVGAVRAEKERKLDPIFADALVTRIAPFPVGSTVTLSTGELAIVLGYVGGNRLHPRVRPYLRKIRQEGREEIIRLGPRDIVDLLPDSRVRIVINEQIYRQPEEKVPV